MKKPEMKEKLQMRGRKRFEKWIMYWKGKNNGRGNNCEVKQ